MTPTERKIHSAVYKLITPDRPAIIVPRKEEGDRKYLETLLKNSRKQVTDELTRLVKKKHFTKAEATEIATALDSFTKIVDKGFCLVAVYAELKDSDLYLHSVGVSTNGTEAGEV